MKKVRTWLARVLLAAIVFGVACTGAPKGTHGWGIVGWGVLTLVIIGIFMAVVFKLVDWAFDD